MHYRPPTESDNQGRRAFFGKLAAAGAGAAGFTLASAIDPWEAWAEARAMGPPTGSIGSTG